MFIESEKEFDEVLQQQGQTLDQHEHVFRNLIEAYQAVFDNEYIPVKGRKNVVYVNNEGSMRWSFVTNSFVHC